MITKIILISGKQGSGKTTLRENLVKYFEAKGNIVKYMKLAKYIYEVFYAIKKTLQTNGHFEYDPVKLDQFDGELLQYIGTEYAQRKWGKTIWVDNLCQNILDIVIPREYIIIDDCRFKHEISTIKEKLNNEKMKIVTIRLEAPEQIRKVRAEKWRENISHPSEIDLNDYTEFDLTLYTENMDQWQSLKEVTKFLGVE
jgi:phosphomevalonate kinase